jgi:hypothetical protein
MTFLYIKIKQNDQPGVVTFKMRPLTLKIGTSSFMLLVHFSRLLVADSDQSRCYDIWNNS